MHQTLLRWSLGRQRAASTACIPGTLTTGTTRNVCGWLTLGKAIGWRSLLCPQTCSGLIPRPSALGMTTWRSKMVSWTNCFSVFLLDCMFFVCDLIFREKTSWACGCLWTCGCVGVVIYYVCFWEGGGGGRGGAWEGDFYYLVEMLNIDAENTTLSHMVKW